MADLILGLNKLFRGRGLELDLEKWEQLNASMTIHKTEEKIAELKAEKKSIIILIKQAYGQSRNDLFLWVRTCKE
jgi:hypothetical protein